MTYLPLPYVYERDGRGEKAWDIYVVIIHPILWLGKEVCRRCKVVIQNQIHICLTPEPHCFLPGSISILIEQLTL